MSWAVIRCNLASSDDEQAFNAWYNREHAPRYIQQAGFRRGWRLEKLDHPAQRGNPGQRYLAVYDVDALRDFNAALERDFADGHPWESWESKIVDWQRTYYDQIFSSGRGTAAQGSAGRFWTIVRVDLVGLDSQREVEFNRWYDNTHVPEVTAFPGFQRAWRLKVATDPGGLGPVGQTYMAVYETDDVDYLPRVRAGTVPWDGVWADHICNWEIGFYRKIYDHETQENYFE